MLELKFFGSVPVSHNRWNLAKIASEYNSATKKFLLLHRPLNDLSKDSATSLLAMSASSKIIRDVCVISLVKWLFLKMLHVEFAWIGIRILNTQCALFYHYGAFTLASFVTCKCEWFREKLSAS